MSKVFFKSICQFVIVGILMFCSRNSVAQDSPLLKWAGSFKGTAGGPTSFGYGIDTDASGNVYSTGSFNGTVDFDPGAGVFSLTSASTVEQDIYISKLDADGNFVWAVRFGAGGRNDYGYAITSDAVGNIYITGQFFANLDFDPGPGIFVLPNSLFKQSLFVLKLDTDGNFVWAKSIGTGGLESVVGRSIALDNSGNLLITGLFSSTADFDPGAGTFNLTSAEAAGGNNAFLCKLDASGNFAWARAMLGTGAAEAYSIVADNSDNVIAVGAYSGTIDFDPSASSFNLTSVGNFDAFISKLDASGNFIWAKSLGGSSNEYGNSIAVDNAGSIFITGLFKGTSDFDPGVGVFNLTSSGLFDSFISKLDANGNFVWAIPVGGSTAKDDSGIAIAIDASGNLLCTGFFEGTIDFDPGAGIYNLTSSGSNPDIYILKLDVNANFIWAVRQGSTNSPDQGNGISTDASSNVYVTGYFSTTADFDFGPCTFNLITGGFAFDKNAFVQKIGLGPTYFPAVTIITPSSGPVGTTVIITGTGFSPTSSDNIVRFGVTSATVSTASSTSLTVIAPSGTGTKGVTVTIGCFTSTPGQAYTYTTGSSPTITSFTPASSSISTTVTITGANFSTTPANNVVQFNGTTAVVSASTATSITTTVPAGATTGKISVTVGGNTATSATNFTVTPTITSFTPTSGPVTTSVTITGTNFSTTPASNIVYFGAVQATVTAATSTQLTVTVPTGATFKPITVSVNGLIAYASKPFVVSFAGGGPIDNCSFAPALAIGTVSTSSFNSALCDLDGDGKMDLLIPEFSSNQLAIFRNTSVSGTASFAPKIPLTGLTEALSTAVGDLDGDGKPDIAVANYTNGQLSVYKNLSTPGTISVATRVTYSIPAFTDDVSIADIDGDGKQDLIISASIQGLIVLRNQGSPGVIDATTFAAGVTFATGANAYPIALGDLDGDGKLDAIVPNANTYTLSVFRNTSTPGTVSFAASVTLTTNTGTPTAGFGTGYVSLGDIDGDNKLDIVAVSNTVTKLSLFRNTSTPGTLTFDPRFDIATTGIGAAPPLSDLNGDGKLDLVADNGQLQMLVFESTASSGAINATTFKTPIIIPRASSAIPQLGDVDGDGRNDIISTATNVQVFQNLIGTISPPTIASFSPTSGIIGATVTITGTNFNSLFSKTVEFNGTPATVTGSTATTLTVTVPVGATTGPVKVTIGCNAITGSNFTVGSPASITITITTQPSNFSACFGQTPIVTFTTAATGTTTITYQWQLQKIDFTFDDVVDGGAYAGSNTPTLTVNTGIGSVSPAYRCIINGDFAIQQVSNTASLLTVFPPLPPSTTGANRCGTGSITLTASGGTNGQYKWYTVASGGTAIAGEVNGSYITPSLSSTSSYFVSLTTSICESARTSVTATINPLPPTPTTTGASACLPSASVTLNASGGTSGQYRWYTVSLGGTAIAGQTGSSFITPALSASTTYFVSIDNGTCESVRTPVIASLLSCTTPPSITSAPLSTSIGGTAELDLVPLISTVNNPLNISSITVMVQPPSGAVASVSGGKLNVDYKNISFSGKESITIRACDTNGNCATQQFEIEVAGDVVVYNAVSPDGKNPILRLEFIDTLSPKNQVSIYNRWGDEVFSISDYDNKARVFAGLGNGGSKLPAGTYFYKIVLSDTGKSMTGFLSLKY
jgi:CHU_C Type IX secretion signal domain/Ig-like domain CHU_C associated/FG-GAP-like repeat/IPT/TIG domain